MKADKRDSWWARRALPVRVGLICGTIGLLLALVGIARGNVPFNPLSILLALAISAGGWGLVSWAIATAAVDVETDLAEAEASATASEATGESGQTPGAGSDAAAGGRR